MTLTKFLHSGHYFIDKIKYLAKNGNDKYFFEPESMRFFNSRISALSWKINRVGVKGLNRYEVEKYYFITSEKQPLYSRFYTVWSCDHKGNIEKISEFQEFMTLYQARRFLYNFLNEELKH